MSGYSRQLQLSCMMVYRPCLFRTSESNLLQNFLSAPPIVVYTSAWPNPEETFDRLSCMHSALPVKEAFVKRMEIAYTTRNRRKMTVTEGWYSKEDMAKELKWNPMLVFVLATFFSKLHLPKNVIQDQVCVAGIYKVPCMACKACF